MRCRLLHLTRASRVTNHSISPSRENGYQGGVEAESAGVSGPSEILLDVFESVEGVTADPEPCSSGLSLQLQASFSSPRVSDVKMNEEIHAGLEMEVHSTPDLNQSNAT